LVQLDMSALYAAIGARLTDPARADDALAALARMRANAELRVHAPNFDAYLSRADAASQRTVRRLSRRLRFRQALPLLPFVVVPAAPLAAATAAAFKWLPGMANYALVQATGSAGMGAFHGITAGVIWAGTIVFGVTLYYRVFANEFVPRSSLRPFGAL